MNNTQHTAGPWKALPVEPGKEVIRIRGTRLGERHKIANVFDFDYKEMPQAFVDKERAESLANANLIAAAPELLEALEMMIDGGLEGPTTDAIDKASAAIAKAKGGCQ